MAVTSTFQFAILLSLLLVSFLGVEGEFPPSCKRYECPNYNVIDRGNNYEIRQYNSPVWISNSTPFLGTSLVGAIRFSFGRLFSYICGNNNFKKVINMTAPVITQVFIGEKSPFVVSFYVPKENQAYPPLADGLELQRWNLVTVAVRQFGGFLNDSNVGEQVSALKASLAKTAWSSFFPDEYIVAQYNSPFELYYRVNEIWFLY